MAGKHRAIREVPNHPTVAHGYVLVCFSCGASVADTEGHIRFHAEVLNEEIELDVNAGSVILADFDAPDSWQRAEIEDAARDQARTRGERWRQRREQRRRQALAAELAQLKDRARAIKTELEGGEQRGENAS